MTDSAQSAAPTTVPSKILIQVRDGVPNLLAEFELEIVSSEPLAPDHPDYKLGARQGHEVSIMSMVEGLFLAVEKLGGDWSNDSDDLDQSAKVAGWIIWCAERAAEKIRAGK